ncbi:hypothetical protein BFN03_18545 [Rhodococcus sp. WMMA185]|uniref:hypothetical protein n=1 Tax=Rhodococcus sp. WMMA185 TaxID=679318 RepID=UPI00087893F4|nr:hypothetical protein [Rhodococcus sp. WMMA185]AOW93989.1 hypothetical protein BFN03_18545 [Rhodococcus sp. WMMA185]
MSEPPGASAGAAAFTEHILSTGERLELQPDAIERLMKACDKLAEDMEILEKSARRELGADEFGLGEKYPNLHSAQQLAQKFRSKAIGGNGIDDANTAVGLFAAHRNYALEMKAMLQRVLDAYNKQEATMIGNLEGIGIDQ